MFSTSEFFEALYPTGVGNMTVEIRIDSAGGIVRSFHTSAESLIAAVRPHYAGARSVWFGPGLRMANRGRDADVGAIPALWSDCDSKCFVSQNKTDAIAHLLAFSQPPSIVVDTGHGAQGYWLLSGYATGTDIAEARMAMRWLHDALSKSKALTTPLDAVHNPSRVMRLPNTYNRKDTPILCRIIEANLRRYTLGDFGRVSDPITTDTQLLAFTPSTDPPQQILKRALPKLPTWVQQALCRPDNYETGDDSGLDLAVAIELARVMTPGEVEAVWLASMLGSRTKTQTRPDYRRLTISRAFAAAAQKRGTTP